MTRFFRLPALLALLFLFPRPCLAEQHQVLSLISEAEIDSSGALTVLESYRVQFRRGSDDFCREVRYAVPKKGPKAAPKLLDLQMDGSDISKNDVEIPEQGVFRIHIRTEKPKTLPEGIHVLSIRYRLYNQAELFADRDQLTWDVAGTERGYGIQELLYVFIPPSGAKILANLPSEGLDIRREQEKDGRPLIAFSRQTPLAPHEGLPIAVSWNKGLIATPPEDMNAAREQVLRIAAVSGICLLIYFSLIIWRIRALAKKPAGCPSAEPPRFLSQSRKLSARAMSPSELHFLTTRGNVNGKGLAAALLSLAGQGFCTIEKKSSAIKKNAPSGYTVKAAERENSPDGCGETALLTRLRQQKSTVLNGESIRSLIDVLSQALLKTCAPSIQHDVGPVWIGILLAIGAVCAILYATLGSFVLWPEEIYTFLMGIFVLAGIAALFVSPGFWRMGLMARLIILFLFFLLGSLTYDNMENVLSLAPKWMFTASVILLLLPLPFFFLIRLPVAQARRGLAEAKRFALFISRGPEEEPSQAESERYAALAAYAAALGLEEEWKQKCAAARAKNMPAPAFAADFVKWMDETSRAPMPRGRKSE